MSLFCCLPPTPTPQKNPLKYLSLYSYFKKPPKIEKSKNPNKIRRENKTSKKYIYCEIESCFEELNTAWHLFHKTQSTEDKKLESLSKTIKLNVSY